MNNSFSLLGFVEELLQFSPRQGQNEGLAADFIRKTLKKKGVNYAVHEFGTILPSSRQATLVVDGKEVRCEPCSFVGGNINGKEHMVSSLVGSKYLLDVSNINFNPLCEGISLSNFYFAPAVAIAKKDVSGVLNGAEVKGQVDIKPTKHTSQNILVGNTVDPTEVVFAHYDSIARGATDNAAGTAVMMQVIFSEPNLLNKALFVLAGNEELSYDRPTYWGHGYRAFEAEYLTILSNARSIMVIDSVGNGQNRVSQDRKLIELAFPIKGLDRWQRKISICHGDMANLMQVYHSELDDINQLRTAALEQAGDLCVAQIKKGEPRQSRY